MDGLTSALPQDVVTLAENQFYYHRRTSFNFRVRRSASDNLQYPASASLSVTLVYAVHSGSPSLTSLSTSILETRPYFVFHSITFKTSRFYIIPKEENNHNTKKEPAIKADSLVLLGNVLLSQGETPNYHRRKRA